MHGVTVLGATGSIGKSTLDVLSSHPDKFSIVALTANTNVDLLFNQCLQYQPHYAVMRDTSAAEQLLSRLKNHNSEINVLAGEAGLDFVASLPQVKSVVAGIVGAQGLSSTLAAAKAGKRLLLANKEALVMAGSLLINEAIANTAEIIPVDSEHNAIFQCMPAGFKVGQVPAGVERIIITASGGPFRTMPLTQLSAVTPAQACAHPNWNMGKKISVDSATMVNKALEVIEAYWLFSKPINEIKVVLHPQSVIHSLVDYADGSVLAQLGNPDMRTPIACALAWPQRVSTKVERLDLIKISRLDFQEVCPERYPCLGYAYDVLKSGGNKSVLLNAANEIAVDAFLSNQISFTQIAEVIEYVLIHSKYHSGTPNLIHILEDDRNARILARELIEQQKSVA